ncbi:hypothetical protein [Acidithiobacillus ferrivorans]|jgi:hypothetical protein|uniref:Uncharacterized protein n=1 Tax=Acidithiobacillus ferrivorans TaxID=160808 RepID=A0A7T4WEV2_9PROT|nr:hypothetical protein [Acidithiobacillus ferrivorans]MBN6740427.1 hypothetical protein [Acidithiobacillus sp. MC6.1]QQD73326.1 hypothetical protein H2515_03155 [Acidithiobacillus ferrivorans]
MDAFVLKREGQMASQGVGRPDYLATGVIDSWTWPPSRTVALDAAMALWERNGRTAETL